MLNDGFVEGRQLQGFFFQVQVTSCFDQSSHYLENVQKTISIHWCSLKTKF